MSDKDLYLPLFYSSLELTESLSDAEFGLIVRMLLTKLGGGGAVSEDSLPRALRIAYNFMLEGAERIIGRHRAGGKANNNKPTETGKRRYGNFDPRVAFEKALERTYGKQSPASDGEVRQS